MRNNKQQSRRGSGLLKSLLALVIVVIGGVGTVGTLWAMGEIELPFLNRGPRVPPGHVLVPASGSTIPVYTKLTRDHILEPQTGQLATLMVAEDQLTPDVIRNVNAIIGRVLDHEKPKGYVFTEADFMPKGTRPGLVAGIPPGKRSMTLEAGKLAGVFGLKPGDHIDVVATVPIDSKNNSRIAGMNGALAAQSQMATMQKLATVRVLAQDAVIVSPVTSRQKPTSSSSLTNGTQVRTVPIQEIVIAVDPKEVAPITQALATDVDVTCIARSGLPDDPGADSKTPGSDPLVDMRIVDSLHGTKKREALVFTASGQRRPAEDELSSQTPLSNAKPAPLPSVGKNMQMVERAMSQDPLAAKRGEYYDLLKRAAKQLDERGGAAVGSQTPAPRAQAPAATTSARSTVPTTQAKAGASQ